MTMPGKCVVCFGEILWDNLTTGRTPGGAPMNVAFHLNQLGTTSYIISKVGDDSSGKDLLNILSARGLSTSYCQVDLTYPTSEVMAIVSENHNVRYEILAPVAWDYIEWTYEIEPLVLSTDAFVYGSLITRNEVSRDILHKLLDSAKFRVCDINLRSPHYTIELANELLRKTDFLKLNEEELLVIGEALYPTCSDENELVNSIQKNFSIPEILLTRGRNGASYYCDNIKYNHPGYNVIVEDTIGSGDACLAGFLFKRLDHSKPEEALDFACVMGAFNTTLPGACPDYTESSLQDFTSALGTTNKVNSRRYFQTTN